MHGEDMAWVGGEYRSLKGITMREVIEEWFEGEGELIFDHELCRELPEIVWAATLEISQGKLTDDQKGLLAAGPLEDLLSFHGNVFIEQVEKRTQEDARFNDLLGGVWQNEMTPDIWERVQKARHRVW